MIAAVFSLWVSKTNLFFDLPTVFKNSLHSLPLKPPPKLKPNKTFLGMICLVKFYCINELFRSHNEFSKKTNYQIMGQGVGSILGAQQLPKSFAKHGIETNFEI